MITLFKPASIKLIAVLLGIASISSVEAANFKFARYLEIGSTATDNPDLLRQDPEAELVLNFKPSIELTFSGNRFGAIVIGEAEYYRFTQAKEGISDPRLFARTRGTVVDNLVFLDTTLTYSKISPDSNYLRLSQQNNDAAFRFKTSLYLEKSFDESADLYLSYNHGSFFVDLGEGPDSYKNGLEFSVGRNPKYGGATWGLGANASRDKSIGNQLDNGSVYGSLGVVMSRIFHLKFTSGIEHRGYSTAIDTNTPIVLEDDQSSLWNAGITWSPSVQTNFTIGYGERFFGEGPNFSLYHRTEKSIVLARFSRDITRTTTGLGSISSLTDGTGVVEFGDTDSVTIDDSGVGQVLEEPFIDNRFQLSYKLLGRRSDLIFDAVYSLKDQLAGDEEIKTLVGRLVFDRRLSERTRLRLQYEHQKSDSPQDPDKIFTENRVGLKFIFNFDRVESSRDKEFTEE